MHSSPLLALPSELLHQVASCLTLDNDVSDLSNFASSCHIVRVSIKSLLFCSITVASAGRLESLSYADAQTLGHMRHFTLQLEYDFFEVFAAACRSTALLKSPALQHQSVLPALAHILLSAPQLNSLRVQIPDSLEDYCTSAWTQALRLSIQGVALGSALACILPENTTFPALRALHLDGISQLAPLVRMTPNLTALSARMCEGFSEVACRDLIHSALPLIPCLEQLAFDPFSLYFENTGLNVPKAIMAAAPGLQTLDLRSRAFDFSTGHTEWRTTGTIDPLVCVPTGTRLRELYLPFAPPADEGVNTVSAGSHKATLFSDRARETEILAVVQLASASPLEKVSWLRADDEVPVEYVVRRDGNGIPVQISVVECASVEPNPMALDTELDGAPGFSSNIASLRTTVASSTVFRAAVVISLLSESVVLPLHASFPFATPALLASGVALGIATRARCL